MKWFNHASTRWHVIVALALSSALAVFGLAAPSQARPAASAPTHAAAQGAPGLVTHLSGTTEDGRHLRGTFTPTSFDLVDGALMVTGEVTGRLVGKGAPTSITPQEVTTQVLSMNGTDLTGQGAASAAAQRLTTASNSTAAFVPAAASCPILNLVLGPLDLDLLGLQVHLDQVVLDIVAQSGAGNLLGNLLCSVAGLLDGGLGLDQLLGQLTGLLQQILGVLGGLQV